MAKPSRKGHDNLQKQKNPLHLGATTVYRQVLEHRATKQKIRNIPKMGLHLRDRGLYVGAMETQGGANVLIERSIMVLMLVLWILLGCAGAWPLSQAAIALSSPEGIPLRPLRDSFPDIDTNPNISLWSGL
jgi:hypothetical protein